MAFEIIKLTYLLNSTTSHSELEIFVHTDHIMTKLCRGKLGDRVLMNHRVHDVQL